MLKKLKVTSHAFIFCLFGFTLMTVFLFSPNVYAQSSGTNMQNEAQDNLMINNQRIATGDEINRLNEEIERLTKKLENLTEYVMGELKALGKEVYGSTINNKNGEDTGLNLEPEQGNGVIRVPECSFEGTC